VSKKDKKLLKIKKIFKTKKLGTSAVIFISFFLIFIQTAGSFYSKALSGFSYAGLIIIDAFYLLKNLISNNKFSGLKKAQLASIILNAAVLMILSITVVLKSLSTMTTHQTNADVVILTTWVTCMFLIVYSSSYKKFMYTSIFSIFITVGFGIFKNYHQTDFILSIFFCIITLIRSAILIKDTILDYKK
jgi:hypothetical protein